MTRPGPHTKEEAQLAFASSFGLGSDFRLVLGSVLRYTGNCFAFWCYLLPLNICLRTLHPFYSWVDEAWEKPASDRAATQTPASGSDPLFSVVAKEIAAWGKERIGGEKEALSG